MQTFQKFPHPSLASIIRSAALIGVALTVTVLLTGCGGGKTPPTQDASAPTAQSDTSQSEHGDEHSGEHAGEGGGQHQGEHGGEHEGGHSGPRGVEIGTEKARSLGIRADTLRAGSASSSVTRPASVQFDPDQVAQVGPRVEGKVVRVLADLGDRVGRGEAIAVLSSVELGRARSDYLSAQAHLQTARRAYEREQTLFRDSISSEADYLEAKAQFEEAKARLQSARETLRIYGAAPDTLAPAGERERPLSHFRVTSPVAGTLQKRDVEIGTTVGPQEMPFHVANASSMWVMIDGYERDVSVMESGQRVTLSVRSLPDATFEGRINFISKTLEEETRTLRLQAAVPNTNGELRDGMYGHARIQTDATVERALISADAVQTIGGASMTFVPGEENGHFRAVEVRTGEESQEGMVEIVSGLRPGDVAVTQGAFNLKAALTAGERSAAHSH